MSRTKNAAELYGLVVEETYGELTSRIFGILLCRGRQNIYEMAQCTRLPPRHIRHGLAVLVQQNLVYWHTEPDSEITYYEANKNAAYSLLRSGKIIELVSLRFGPLAQSIVQRVLFEGHARIGDLLAYSELTAETVDAHVNGDGEAELLVNGVQDSLNERVKELEMEEVEAAIYQLLESGIVAPVIESKLQSPSDLYHQVEREILRAYSNNGIKGTKQKEELNVKVAERLREIRSDGERWQSKGGKRALDGAHTNGGEKRQKLSNGVERVEGGSRAIYSKKHRLEHDLNVKINYEKCMVLLRNQQLVSVVRGDIGETTSDIYSALLGILEDRIPRCQLDQTMDEPSESDEGPTVSTIELMRALGKSINPSLGIGKVGSHLIRTTPLEKPQGKRKRDSDSIVAVESNSDEDGSNMRKRKYDSDTTVEDDLNSDEDGDNRRKRKRDSDTTVEEDSNPVDDGGNHKKRKQGSKTTVEGDSDSDKEGSGQEASSDVNEHGNIPEVDEDSDSDGEDPFAKPLGTALSGKPPSRTTKVKFDDKLPEPVSRVDQTNRPAGINKHLLLLKDHSPQFVRGDGSRVSGEWTVDFDKLVKYMQDTELDDFIFEKFGRAGRRIVQILKEKGKLEEKGLQKFGFMKLSDIRIKVAEMQLSGVLDVQEVAKDLTHVATRTIFLWYFDHDRVKAIFLDHIYKAMSRLLQVLKARKYDERDVLSQAERTDVIGHEEEMLPAYRLGKLNEIRRKEKMIFTQIGRLDTLVAIFQEF